MVERTLSYNSYNDLQKARELEILGKSKSMPNPYRENEFKHVEDKEHTVIAKYRRIDWTMNTISFQYKLKGQWFWKNYTLRYTESLKKDSPDHLELQVKNWLECYARTGQV